MKLKIEIEMNSAAFEGKNRNQEATRILHGIATEMERGLSLTAAGDWETLNDINGNRVGTARVTH